MGERTLSINKHKIHFTKFKNTDTSEISSDLFKNSIKRTTK